MVKKVIFISDYFLDEVTGGAEFCNDSLIKNYLSKNYEVYKLKSSTININFLLDNKDEFYIIANYMQLKNDVKSFLSKNSIRYIIIEHDHKYLVSNNPAIYSDFLANEDEIENIEFCKNAIAVLCQSILHTKIVYKNTLLKNLINLGGNIWSDEQVQTLLDNIRLDDEKEIDNLVYNSKNLNKGTFESVEYCKKNNINFSFLESSDYKTYIENISKAKRIIFLPVWVETFNRFLVEAKILNCKIVTNNLIGSASEGLLRLSGLELLDEIKARMNNIYSIFENLINGNVKVLNFYYEKLPRITIMTTFIDSENYINQYLEEVTKQTIFNEVDLLLLDAGSTGTEEEIIKKYTIRYPNIKHLRIKKLATISEAFNIAMKETDNELISMIQVDDRPSKEYCEVLRKHIFYSQNIDLVYGDCLQTAKSNETFCDNTANILYEHSINNFSKHNMIKCLPGPMPMFKKSMIQKYGGFDPNLIYSNDWELWLRCVRGGSIFKKVNKTIGLYYFNPDGKSTSLNNLKDKLKEERNIFNEYIDILGQKNYLMYKEYFNRELK